jgi:hypothetical protein
LPGRKRREKSIVATYLNTKQSNISSYIKKWFDYTYDLWEIRKIIERTKEYKENLRILQLDALRGNPNKENKE